MKFNWGNVEITIGDGQEVRPPTEQERAEIIRTVRVIEDHPRSNDAWIISPWRLNYDGPIGGVTATPRRKKTPPALRPSSIIAAEPERIREEQAMAKAVIDYAAAVKDMRLLNRAVAAKIEDQKAFVGWWDANVSIGHGGDRSKVALRQSCSVPEAESQTGIRKEQVLRWRHWLKDEKSYATSIVAGALSRAALVVPKAHDAHTTGIVEWFTPPDWIPRIRKALGAIDLDPATHPKAQADIKAKKYFTIADDGLKQPWKGRVYLNPPFARGMIEAFVAKLLDELKAHRTTAAIMLVHANTETGWFQEAGRQANAICFPHDRIAFIHESGVIAAPTRGQAFFHFGAEPRKFVEIFEDHGLLLGPRFDIERRGRPRKKR